MEMSVEKHEEYDYHYKYDYHYRYDGYTVYVGDHRILTIYTESYDTATKWLKEVRKIHCNNKHNTLLVGVYVDRQFLSYERHGLKDSPYDLISLCIGSHCLIYRLLHPEHYRTPRILETFFTDPAVIAVGMNMVSVAKKLMWDHGIKFVNPVDLNTMAMKGMKRDDLDIGRYDLDRLAKVVLGKRWDIVRPKQPVEWYERDEMLTVEKVMFVTVDTYFYYRIGSELLDMMNCLHPLPSSLKTKKNKKK
ncbi:unnamed protein product [Ilex paraguariensis]|uniref:Uncharacterized protein n=1 Tax=Ilex paraguariensis TaxID=185542 RepID=A0ABC8S7K1_9AQUA